MGTIQATETLEAIVQSASDAIITANGEGNIVTWNPAAAQMFGYTEDEAVGQSLTMVVPERFQDAHREGLGRVASGGETHIIGTTVQVAGVRKDGSEFPVELSLATWVTNGNRFFSGILRDVTEQAELARHLAASQQRLEAILNSANDAIVSIDERGKVVLWNAHAADLFGYTEEEMMGEGLGAVIPERFREAHTAGIERVVEGGERHVIGSTAELAGLHRDGREFPMELSLATWTADKERLFIGIIRDITEREKAEEALHVANKSLNLKNEQLEHIIELRKGWAEKAGATSLHVRMGINTGYCTVGTFGSEERLDYTIVGGPVNVASRLESTAEADQIHITHETYSLVKDEIYCRPTGDIKVKGVAHELRTYEVIGSLLEQDDGKQIQAETAGFNLQFDATAITTQETEVAWEALQTALAALDEGGDD